MSIFPQTVVAKHLVVHRDGDHGCIIHGKGDFLKYDQSEHPVALQLGGSNAKDLSSLCKLAEERGYDEINLNVGCPSDRVQNGRFGACLMAEPELVAECVAAMKSEVSIPVTVKTRIGIDDQDSYEFLTRFVSIVNEQGGCEDFTIHARKAWLSGLSPKENREIPPLDYPRAYQIKKDFSDLNIAVNGGVKSLDEALEHLEHLDGVMIGREAYQSPYILSEVDQRIFGEDKPVIKRSDVVKAMYPYIDQQLSEGAYLGHITRHMLGLFQSMPGARQWRRHISENAHKKGADLKVLQDALAKIPAELEV
ncbi:tRNA dihydrouridine synthase A [Vibrio sp. JCM 19236]|nr:tRNA dihydrouridine synthase A [Vibrio sp. JCM 19236]